MYGNIGIYKITNSINGKFYIGSSVDLKKRKRDHLRELRDNIHINGRLQNSFNKYKEKNFRFDVVETVENKAELRDREQYWMDKTKAYNRHIGFNINRLATGGGNYGEDNGNYGNLGIKNPLSKQIAQIDPDTLEVIKIWGASIEIQRELGYHGGSICKMCIQAEKENVLRKSNGYFWCYEKDIDNIRNMKEFKPKKRTTTGRDYLDIRGSKNPRARKVVQLSLDGEYINVYSTIKKAAEENNISANGIYSHLSNKNRKQSGGYKWMYYEDYQALTK